MPPTFVLWNPSPTGLLANRYNLLKWQNIGADLAGFGSYSPISGFITLSAGLWDVKFTSNIGGVPDGCKLDAGLHGPTLGGPYGNDPTPAYGSDHVRPGSTSSTDRSASVHVDTFLNLSAEAQIGVHIFPTNIPDNTPGIFVDAPPSETWFIGYRIGDYVPDAAPPPPPPPPPPGTEGTVTWNPNDKGPNIVLSNGNIDVTGSGSGWNAVRATVGKTTGKYYWEMKILTEAAGNYNMLGAMNSSALLTSHVGGSPSGCGKQGGYGPYVSGWTKVSNPTDQWAVNDVAMFAIDMDTGKMWIGRNGTWLASGNPAGGTNPIASGLSGTVYAAASYLGGPQYGSARLRTKAAEFSYVIPSGFQSYATQ